MKQITKEEIMEMCVTLCYPDGSDARDFRLSTFIQSAEELLSLLRRNFVIDWNPILKEYADKGQDKMMIWWDEEEVVELSNHIFDNIPKLTVEEYNNLNN